MQLIYFASVKLNDKNIRFKYISTLAKSLHYRWNSNSVLPMIRSVRADQSDQFIAGDLKGQSMQNDCHQ